MGKTNFYGFVRAAVLASLILPFTGVYAADAARFDLTGPKVEVKVTRGGSVLPIAQVPNLQPGDKLWVHPAFPTTQSVHLLVIVSFLRGTTNPPPDEWFTKIESWDKKVKREGVYVTVPKEAQQALIFIAPETGGDFSTLKSAVRGRPGIFVRAAADLNEASFEQSRIEHYLDAMRTINNNDPKAIAEHSEKLASTLNLKPNKDCFKQPVDQQVSCLRQSGNQTLLQDGHGETIAAQLSSGASSDFINAASNTRLAGAGMYSAYVGAVVDLVRLMSGLHTAQYQYIPSIAFPEDKTLNLRLNAPPSFHNPKSVIVVGLPAIQNATPPPLRPRDPNQVSCLLQPHMVLRLEGAPLVYATGFAHDLVLHLNRTAEPTDLPMKPDAFEGGLAVVNDNPRKPLHEIAIQNPNTAPHPDTPKASPTDLTVTGEVRGYWGFDTFNGPTVTVQQIPGKGWKLVGDTQLFAGKENHIHLQGEGTSCIQSITLQSAKGRGRHVDISFKPAPASAEGAEAPKDTLELKVPLQKVDPGGYELTIKQFGSNSADTIPLTAYTSAVRLDNIQIHTGDTQALLEGNAVGDVVSVELAGQTLTPTGSTDGKAIQLIAKNPVRPNPDAQAKAKLKDGRIVDVDVTVVAARPGLKLLSMKPSIDATQGALAIDLTGKDQIPVSGKLVFVVQTEKEFPRSQKLEIATADGSLHTLLSLADASLILQDTHTAIATLVPLKVFGPSAFGKLEVRPIAEDGTTGNWTPLGTLVRTPAISDIQCDRGASTCTLSGSNLFLLDSVGTSPDFATSKAVPSGFADNTLEVPASTDGKLYLKLRDDPSAAAVVIVPNWKPQTRKAVKSPADKPTSEPATAAPSTEPATAGISQPGANSAPPAAETAPGNSGSTPATRPTPAQTPSTTQNETPQQ
ncbi:MAG: hypothetical protein JSS87_12555 [Acidobacteria bacterium]|nr:hypothetical protein [Acidobacteriota bacterium]